LGGLPPGCLPVRSARGELTLVLGLLGLEARLRTGLDLGLGGGDDAEALLTTLQLQRDVELLGQRLVVGLLGQAHQLLDLALELLLQAVGMLPAQRLVLAGIGFDLGAVEADAAELDQPHGLRDEQDLGEQRRQLVEETLAEVGDGAVVGVGVGADVAKRDRVVGRLRELAAGEHARGIAVEQQRHQHRRVIGLGAGAGVGPHQRTKVELIDDLHHKPGQMVLGQILLHRRREKIRCLPIDQHEVDGHAAYPRLLNADPIVLHRRGDKSDRVQGEAVVLAAAKPRPGCPRRIDLWCTTRTQYSSAC
jgi:hypothetical protein